MGCDKPENQPDPTSFHTIDDLALSIRHSGAVEHNSVIQGGGFTSRADVASSPLVSLPAVHPLPGNVDEMNNFQMVNLKSLHTFHQHQLEPNLINGRNIAPSFPASSEMPHSVGNVAGRYHLNMNSNMPTSDSFLNEGALSMGIQNPGVGMNFMPTRSNVASRYPAVEKSGKETGISQTSLQASERPFDLGYSMQDTNNIGGVRVNPVSISSPKNIDGDFLTLGIGSNIEGRSKFRFSSKEVSNRLEEAVLPQINQSDVQQMRRNISSIVRGGTPNFHRDSGALPISARNLGVSTFSSNTDEIMLTPGSRTSSNPFTYLNSPPDMQLNYSNSINSGAVGKADLRLSEPDPFMSAQGDLTPSLIPFSNNTTINPSLGYAKTAAASEPAQPVWVAAQQAIQQQGNCYSNISRNQSFMESPILSHASGTMRQDHLGQQSFVNSQLNWGNKPLGSQIVGRTGIQHTPGNQFPKRLGVHLNDGAISQDGVVTGMGGIQQIRNVNSSQSQGHGPAMHPSQLLHHSLARGLHPPFAMGQAQSVSPAQFNVSGVPYYAGQSIPIPKVDVTPQSSNIHAPTSLKRRASAVSQIASLSQRRRTLAQLTNQQLLRQKLNIGAPVPASSSSLLPHVTWQGAGESVQPIGEKCLLCKRDVAFNPEGPVSRPAVPPPVAVLPCGHVFHDHCLQIITPKDQSTTPPCIPCALGET